jgi:hypothetical protein
MPGSAKRSSRLALDTIQPCGLPIPRGLIHSTPDVKQQLAAVRMLFDWLITGQIVPHNPAEALRAYSMPQVSRRIARVSSSARTSRGHKGTVL